MSMSYLAIAILFLLVVGGFITFLVLNATRRSNPAGTDGAGAPGVGADDATPLGDTPEHADADEDPHRGATAVPDGRFKRDPVGGEAEAAPFAERDTPRR